MCSEAIKIQAAFRGFQVRKQYRKILWSVGVLEKAILRWRLKKKGLRGFHFKAVEPAASDQGDTEEDFYITGRKQAEERVERAVAQVQVIFRSRKAREEYERMKSILNQATLEYEDFLNSRADMVTSSSTAGSTKRV